MKRAKSLFSASTELSADTIESHPWQSGLFAVGTYQIDQNEETSQRKKDIDIQDSSSSTSPAYSRRGRLTLHRTDEGQHLLSCQTVSSIDTSAILDMKWLHPTSSMLSLALATSRLSFYKLNDTSNSHVLDETDTLLINNNNALCLSLDWSDRRGGTQGGYDQTMSSIYPTSGCVSQSDGSLAYIPSLEKTINDSKKSKDDTASGIETWHAHDYEAWVTAWDCWSDGRIVWSGGDDLSLKGWDVRTRAEDNEKVPTFVHRKSFEGGVTAMQSHHLRQHLWAVGSYDSHLRLFDARNPMKPISTTNVGGGIWRVKWHPTDPCRLLVGCMHDGFKVLHVNEPETSEGTLSASNFRSGEMLINTRFDEHESLAYGCDWDRGWPFLPSEPKEPKWIRQDPRLPSLVYSCSFYDSKMHIWRS